MIRPSDRVDAVTSFATKVIPDRVAERAALRFEVEVRERAPGLGHCYVSTYSVASHGYAQVGWGEGGKNHGVTAQRAAWQHWNGPIPDGMTVDHRCRNRPCVRREHLRLRTNPENASDNGQVKINEGCGVICGCGEEKVMSGGEHAKPYCRGCQNRRRRERRAAGRIN